IGSSSFSNFKYGPGDIISFSEIIPKLNDKEKIVQSSALIEKEGKRLLNLVAIIFAPKE
ncbi:hypothetical protein H8J65_14780, partial [Clostridium perfringens]|nr:hypothetical protein [Clostridium perfringens]